MKRLSMLCCLAVLCCAFLMVTSLAFGYVEPPPPAGGWDFYNTDFADLADWNHDNGSDQWDGSAPGVDGTSPGGAMVEEVDGMTVLSVEDTGDPRNDGFAEPSNRKIYFQREAVVDGNIFEGGVTFSAGWRINPNPIEAGADGYTPHDGGKGQVGIVHDGAIAGDGISSNMSFCLDTGGLLYFVDEANVIEVGDEFEFHSIWVTAVMAGDMATVNIYVDTDMEPAFSGDIALADGSDGSFANYVAVGMGSTGRDGAMQVDYVAYKLGVHEPALSAAVSPAGKLPAMWGELKSK